MICAIADCGGKRLARGLCSKHYAQWRNGKDIQPVPTVRTAGVEYRFWIKVNKYGGLPEKPGPLWSKELGECWVWIAGVDLGGYGRFTVRGSGRSDLAHRYSYELVNGPIPEGLLLDHLCRVPACVKPDHLEAVTQAENNRRALRRPRVTHCPRGHPYNEVNASRYRGYWECRICRNIRIREGGSGLRRWVVYEDATGVILEASPPVRASAEKLAMECGEGHRALTRKLAEELRRAFAYGLAVSKAAA